MAHQMAVHERRLGINPMFNWPATIKMRFNADVPGDAAKITALTGLQPRQFASMGIVGTAIDRDALMISNPTRELTGIELRHARGTRPDLKTGDNLIMAMVGRLAENDPTNPENIFVDMGRLRARAYRLGDSV